MPIKNKVRGTRQKIGRDYSPLRRDKRIIWLYLLHDGEVHEKSFDNKLNAGIFISHFSKKFGFKIFTSPNGGIYILYKV